MEELEAVNNPEDPESGTRMVPFSCVIYIERDDFREDPPKKYFRLAPGREVRLKHAYYITCVDVVKDEQTGEVVELHCTYDPETRGGGSDRTGGKSEGRCTGCPAAHALEADVRLYDHLFTKPDPNEVEEGRDFTANLKSRLIGNSDLMPGGTRFGRGSAGQPVPVHEAGLFLHRSGLFC